MARPIVEPTDEELIKFGDGVWPYDGTVRDPGDDWQARRDRVEAEFYGGTKPEEEEDRVEEEYRVEPEEPEATVLSGEMSLEEVEPEPAPKPAKPAEYKRVRALPEEEDETLLQRQQEYLDGLSDEGWTVNPDGTGGRLTPEAIEKRYADAAEGKLPSRAYAPGTGSSPLTAPMKKFVEYSGWMPPFATLRESDPTAMYRPATSLPYYGQRRGFGRLTAWTMGREGFTGVKEGEEQAEKPEELEGIDAASARELITEAESKIIEVGKRAGFRDFEPLTITPAGIKWLRLDLERMGVPEGQSNSVPLEYVLPVWQRMRKQVAQGSQQLKELEEVETVELKGTARELGSKEEIEIEVEVPVGEEERLAQEKILAGKPSKSAKDALKNAGIREKDYDMFAPMGADIDSYGDQARFYQLTALDEPTGATKRTKQELSIPLIYIKGKGWNIDLNRTRMVLSQRKYKELMRDSLQDLEESGLTPRSAYEAFTKNEELQTKLEERAIRHANKRIITFISERGARTTPALYTEMSTPEYLVDYWGADVPAPATPFSPILHPEQIKKFMGPWLTGTGLSIFGGAAAGDIHQGTTPQNISRGKLFELLRTAPSTVAGSWLTTWEAPDSDNPEVIWESLWDHWGSKEHYEMMTTGQWDITERFYDIGDTAAKLLEEIPLIGETISPDSYRWKKALGLGIGIPVLLVEPDPISVAFWGAGYALKPLTIGLKIGRNTKLLNLLEEVVVGADKTVQEKVQAIRSAFWNVPFGKSRGEEVINVINARAGAALGIDAADVVGALNETIKKTETKYTKAKERTQKAVREGDTAKVNEAKRAEIEAEQEVLNTKQDAALQMKAIADQEVRIAEDIAAAAGNPKRGVKDYSDTQKLHQARQEAFADMLAEPAGTGQKAHLYKIEKDYLDAKRDATQNIDILLRMEEKRTKKTLQQTVEETDLRTKRTDIDAGIKRQAKIVARLDRMAGVSDKATEIQAKLAKAEATLKADLTATPKKVKDLGTKGTPQEKWDRYLAQYPDNRVAVRIKQARVELADLGKQLKAEAKKVTKKADRQIDLEKARGALEALKAEKVTVDRRLLKVMEKRFKETPTFVDEAAEEVVEEVVEQTPMERILGATKAQKKVLEKQIREVLKDDKEIWRGEFDRIPNFEIKFGEDGVRVPYDTVNPRYATKPEGWRLLKEAELIKLDLPAPKAPKPKPKKSTRFKRYLASFTGDLKKAREIRLDRLKKLGVRPGDNAISKLMRAAQGVDDSTLELYRVRRKMEVNLVKEKRILAAQAVKNAEAAQKAGGKRLKKLGFKTPNEAQEKIISKKKAEMAAREALATSRTIWDDSLRAYIDGLKNHNALLRRGGRVGLNRLQQFIREMPLEIQAKIANLIGKGMKPTKAAEAVLEDIPKYVQWDEPLGLWQELGIERISEGPAWAEVGTIKEGAEWINPKALREILNERYGKRIVDRFISVQEQGYKKADEIIEGDPRFGFLDEGPPIHEILNSTEDALELLPDDLIRLQNFEELLAPAANRFWQTDKNLHLIAQMQLIKAERSGTMTSFFSWLFRSGAVANNEMSDELRRVVEATEHLATRGYEEVESLLKTALRERLGEEETVSFFTRYMNGESFTMGKKGTKMGETFMNSGVNLWDAVRINLLNNVRWVARIGDKNSDMGNLGLKLKTQAQGNLKKKGVTQLSVRADLLAKEGVEATPAFEARAAHAWGRMLTAEFKKLMGKQGEGLKKAFEHSTAIPKALRSLSVVWWPQGVQSSLKYRELLIEEAWVLINTAPDFPTFMRLMWERMDKKPLNHTRTDKGVRAYHTAMLAGLQAKIESQGIDRAIRITGPHISSEDAAAMNALVDGTWGATKGGLEAFDRVLGIINDLGLPINRQSTNEGLKKAAKESRRIVRIAEDPYGMNAFLPTDIIKGFEDVMGRIEKEIEGTFERTFRDRLGDAISRKHGKTILNHLLGIVRGWRASVVTGIGLANPRYWTNTSVSNFFQLHQEENIKTAAKLSFQSLPVNIPFVGRAFQDYLALKTASGNETGTMIGAIFNPDLQQFWNISSKDAAKTYIRGAKGRIHNVQELRMRAAQDGILSTFESERGLLKATDIKALGGEEGLYDKGLRKFANWNTSIAQMMVYGEQRTRTAMWLEKVINEGATYKEARTATLNSYYDWKHGISDFERAYLTQLMTFWRWWSLAARRHSKALTEQLTKPSSLSKVLTGRTKLGRIRKQLQIARSLDEFSEWEDDTEANIDTVTKEWDALMSEVRPWWSFEKLVFGQKPMPLDHTMYYDDISGKTYTHYTYIGPSITSAEMHTYFLFMASGLSILAAQATNAVAHGTGREPPFIIPKGPLGGEATAGIEYLIKPLTDMLLPYYKPFVEQELGGFRQTWRTRPVSLGENYIIDNMGGREFFNFFNVDINLDNNDRTRMNAWVLQMLRTLPFFGAQLPTIIQNVITAQPDMQDSMSRGMVTMLGNFLGIRKVPFNPSDQIKWEMVDIEKQLKAEEEGAKLPMDRTRHSDVWKK